MEKIGPLLSHVLDELRLSKRLDEYRVIEEWEEIVGGAIAQRAVPIAVERGRVVVQVRSSPWLLEMKMREQDILKRIGEHLGEGVIREIRYVGR
jgi:predicted nucleic acid-binding Zn ribbon protein